MYFCAPLQWKKGLWAQRDCQTTQGYRTSIRLHDVHFIQAAESWETSYDGDLSQMGCGLDKSGGGVNGEEPGLSYCMVTSGPGRTLDFLNPKIHGFELLKIIGIRMQLRINVKREADEVTANTQISGRR